MTDIEEKALIERLRQRTSNSHMLLSNPPKPAPDRDCYTAADMLEAALAFKQEVSDAAEVYEEMGCPMGWEGFEQFIIPAPKPDPLVEIMEQCSTVDAEEGETYEDAMVRNIRAALEARGLEIREKNDD